MSSILLTAFQFCDEDGIEILFRIPKPNEERDPSECNIRIPSLEKDQISVYKFEFREGETVVAELLKRFKEKDYAYIFCIDQKLKAIFESTVQTIRNQTYLLTCTSPRMQDWKPENFLATSIQK